MSKVVLEVKKIWFETFEYTNLFFERRWHILRVNRLESWISFIERSLAFGSSKWRWFWLPWTFGTLYTSEKVLPSNADPKVLNEYQRRVKKAMSMIGLNLADNQFAYIKKCKRPAEACKTVVRFLLWLKIIKPKELSLKEDWANVYKN